MALPSTLTFLLVVEEPEGETVGLPADHHGLQTGPVGALGQLEQSVARRLGPDTGLGLVVSGFNTCSENISI